MRRKQKFLILTAGYGDGHTKVAHALQQALEQYGCQHRLIDLYKEAHPTLNEICRQLYKKSAVLASFGLDYYGWIYYLTRNLNNDSVFSKWIYAFGAKTLAAIIRKEQPTAIISTFPYGKMTDCLRDHGITLPTFTVITDYTLHNRWLHWSPDQYYIASDELKTKLVQRGIPQERITVSGIPIRSQFERVPQRLADTGNRPPSVLVMTGSYMTVPHTIKLANDLLRFPDLEINLVCGRNVKLKQMLAARFDGVPNVRLFGFVEQLHELMSRSTCMITKAGGVTLSEAIRLHIPILIYNPLPGQEKENAAYLASKEIALVSHSIKQLCAQATEVLLHPEKQELMRRRASSIQQPDAADAIVRHMIGTLDGSFEPVAAAISSTRWGYHESLI